MLRHEMRKDDDRFGQGVRPCVVQDLPRSARRAHMAGISSEHVGDIRCQPHYFLFNSEHPLHG